MPSNFSLQQLVYEMPADEKKKYQLEDILSDNVSIMETEDLTYEGTPVLVDEEAKEGFCVECKDQEVSMVLKSTK